MSTLYEPEYYQKMQECLYEALKNGFSRIEVEPAKPKLTGSRKANKAVRRARKLRQVNAKKKG